MENISEKLNAYFDGELSEAECVEIEQLIESDPAVRAAFQNCVTANTLATSEFEDMLEQPVPLHLVKAIKDADITPAPNAVTSAPANAANTQARSGFLRIAASALLLGLGGLGGYGAAVQFAEPQIQIQARGWLAEIADYHRVYETQARHLVEVPASEAEHIEKWLAKTVGVAFKTPDLASHGLQYQGARLLVATGKPVAQLIYTSADGAVTALCLMASDATEATDFSPRDFDGLQMQVWKRPGASYVVVGRQDAEALERVAMTAATEV